MCGIAGIVDLTGKRTPDRAALQAMTDALAHRGPDGEGHLTEPGLAFGHRRLAVIDIAGGKQPFESANGRFVLSFNGEIYNFATLRSALEREGHQFRTRSDTEVLVEHWAAHGAEGLSQLLGMFAFAVWDRREETLTLCRDRFGERPLYYGEGRDGLVCFGSELKALCAAGLFDLTLRDDAVGDYLSLGYVPDPKTIYTDIHKLPPGHVLQWRRGEKRPSPSPWYRICLQPDRFTTLEDTADDLRDRLDRAVADQLVSDVPIGAFLSGGVDSGAIVASMATQTDRPVVTCSIGFDEKSHDERPFARTVATRYKTTHHEHVVPLSAHHLIDTIAATYDEPFADSSALPSYLVCQMAREHVTVALTGDGGDEAFGGYRRYRWYAEEERIRQRLPGGLRRGVLAPLGQVWPKLDWLPRPFRLKTTLQSLGAGSAEGYWRAVSACLPERVEQMVSPGHRRAGLATSALDQFTSLYENPAVDDPLTRMQMADLATWLPGRMLVKTDRAAMAHGLELRPPMLDHRLVEWALSLPPSFRLSDGETKRILKASQETRLPHDILYRPKRGFDLPVARWLRADRNNPVDRLSASEFWKDSGYFDTNAVDRMIVEHQQGRSDYGQELWTVLMFDAFLRQIG